MYALLTSRNSKTIAASLALAAAWLQQDDYYPGLRANAGTGMVSEEGWLKGYLNNDGAHIHHSAMDVELLVELQIPEVCWETCAGNYAVLYFKYSKGQAVEVQLELDGTRHGVPVWGLDDQGWQIVEYSTNAPFLHPLQRMQDWLQDVSSDELLEQLASTPEAFGGKWLAEDVLEKLGVSPDATQHALAAQFHPNELAVIRRLLAGANDQLAA